MVSGTAIERRFQEATQQFADVGVDVMAALDALAGVRLSVHCWQGDDVRGFEATDAELGGGLAVTGSYPGRARNADELRADLTQALSLVPGLHRVNLHACYAETGGQRVDRNALAPEHFARWIDWAREHGLGLDFNPTYFAHPLAASGFTLSHADAAVRQFWVEHGIACRRIGAAMGRALGTPCVTNVWIPDGHKDLPFDRRGPRQRLTESLDALFAEPLDKREHLDAIESKLFGIGSESYVVGSHEFYLGYAITRGKLVCLDMGHFHPTELVADKLSSIALYLDEILLHVSRGVRWDSDHVVIQNDELLSLAQELVRGELLDRTHVGLDYFDASINRVAAWAIGCRATLRALLVALLEPRAKLAEAEAAGDHTARLAWLEEAKGLPWAAVWDYHCHRHGVPVGPAWLSAVRDYERTVLTLR